MKEDTEQRLDRKIVELESELADSKAKREKLKQYTASPSDFMKDCLRRASRSKWKTVDKFL